MEKIRKEKFSCEDCEMAIIAGTVESDPAAKEHLAHCKECQMFAEFQKRVLEAEPVINNTAPGFAQICSARRRQERTRFNCLKFIVLPTAAAAAVLMSAAGVFLHMQSSKELPRRNVEYTLISDNETLSEMLSNSSVTLAWDQATPRENAARKSLKAASSAADWNIEYFNPYSEDLL